MKRNNEAGQVLVIVALLLVVLVGVMGLAIDMGYLRYMKRRLQTAADAAAIAGALALNSCPGGCAAVTTAADSASGENGFTDGIHGVTVTVSYPLAGVVEAVVSQPEPVHFASVFGVNSATVTAKAEAKISSGGNCVYALTTLNVLAGAVDAPKCGMVVEANLACAAGSITATRIGVVGSTGGLLCATTPTPVTIAAPQPTDPLAYLPAPAVGSCGASTGNNTYSGSPSQVPVPVGTIAAFNPGTYCGGILVTGGTANFSPGTYILTGGFTVIAGSVTSTGTGGVTFLNSGPPYGSITFAAGSVNLTASTSGPYEGVLFFQDANDTQGASFAAPLSGSAAGAYYFPNATLSFLADLGQSAAYTILDALNISFTVSTFTINNDYSSLPDGSPIKGGAVLVE